MSSVKPLAYVLDWGESLKESWVDQQTNDQSRGAVLVMVIITMQAFTLYPQVQVMTRGGPLDSTQSLVFQMVQRGYEKQDIAGGSAISVFLFLFVLIISLTQRYLSQRQN